MVADKDDQAVVVAADVEDGAIAGEEVRRPEAVLDVLRRFPLGLLGVFKPRRQRCLRARVLANELLDEMTACNAVT